MPKKQRRGKPKAPPAPARFAVGSKVRVKPGTTDPDFPDIPLGGWAGTITEVDQRTETLYLLEWDQYTLDHMHPVYRNRCERDGLNVESMWLGENDLVPDDGSPASIEQPTAIRTRPLNPKNEDDRVCAALGLTSDDPLPDVDEETLRQYHRYLEQHLSFPFPGTHSQESGMLHTTTTAVTVVGLLDADEIDEMYGLFCKARREGGGSAIHVPLGEIEAKKGDPNRQMLADYCYWFWNWR